MPSVTVVIPAYNCAEFLPEAVESVHRQTMQDWEVIIIDDGSTDNTRDVIVPYLADERIRYVHQENRGLPGARNSGTLLARSEFVAVLDADDMLEETALEQMSSALQDSGASWCIVDILKFWDDHREIQRSEIPGGDLLEGILVDDFIRRAMFFRKDALERISMWDESMRMREDWDLNIRFIAAGERFVYLQQPLYWYRKRPGSITTGNPDKLFAYTEQLLTKHHRRIADAGDRTVARIYAANMWDLARRHYYVRRDVRKAFDCAVKSLKYEASIKRLFHPILHNLSTRTFLGSSRSS